MKPTSGWLKNANCVRLSGFSRDTFTRRRMPWATDRLPGRIRYKNLALDADAEELPRFYLADVQAFMVSSVPMRTVVEFAPVFSLPPAPQDSFHIPIDEMPVTPFTWRIEAAAQFLDVCRDTIGSRLIEWRDEPVPYRIRCSTSELKIGSNLVRLCYRTDVEALLKTPVSAERSRTNMVDLRFHR